jgi:hypothetical protein
VATSAYLWWSQHGHAPPTCGTPTHPACICNTAVTALRAVNASCAVRLQAAGFVPHTEQVVKASVPRLLPFPAPCLPHVSPRLHHRSGARGPGSCSSAVPTIPGGMCGPGPLPQHILCKGGAAHKA